MNSFGKLSFIQTPPSTGNCDCPPLSVTWNRRPQSCMTPTATAVIAVFVCAHRMVNIPFPLPKSKSDKQTRIQSGTFPVIFLRCPLREGGQMMSPGMRIMGGLSGWLNQ